jgi:hypothetical protein
MGSAKMPMPMILIYGVGMRGASFFAAFFLKFIKIR